jgi:DNA-directed RNA polymerase subunit alpha
MAKLIHDAKLAEVIEHSEHSASFVIKPLYSGYGNTLGNSLRRVLLSSIEGAAIVAFRVEGISHEYTTIPGVQEDVIDIMLNLKNVHVKSHADEPVEITVKKSGAGVITAADIKTPAEVEIANPHQIICTIDDPKSSVQITMVVDKGRGYQSIDESYKNRVHDGMIALDAMFSPVLRTRYKVEKTRVGDDTSLDQLSLTIDTDGTVLPREAFEEAAAILINQYSALAGATRVESAPTPGNETVADDATLSLPIEDLDLSARTANALANNDIHTIRELINLSETELKELKGFGAKALDEVKTKLMELKG